MNENNLADKISELLNDPEGMSRIEEMAEKLLGEKGKPMPQNDGNDLHSGIKSMQNRVAGEILSESYILQHCSSPSPRFMSILRR